MYGRRKRKGIGAITATVILAAVAITVIVAVAYWTGWGQAPVEIVTIELDIGPAGEYMVSTTTLTIGRRGNTTVTETLTLTKSELYLGDDGNGWLMVYNGTHMIYRSFILVDEIVIGPRGN